jgi:hypothetical protein
MAQPPWEKGLTVGLGPPLPTDSESYPMEWGMAAEFADIVRLLLSLFSFRHISFHLALHLCNECELLQTLP